MKQPMNTDKIRSEITRLAKEHEKDDDENFEIFESSAEQMIIGYCEEKGYQIEGFPHDKTEPEDAEEDYFSYERYRKYLFTMVIEKEDVADLMWFYVDSFWPHWFDNKQDLIEDAKNIINEKPFIDLEF
jgi:hypothetical protein